VKARRGDQNIEVNSVQELQRKISEVNARWAEAICKQDFTELSRCYTENAAFFPPNTESALGRERISIAFRNLVRNVREIQRRTLEVEIEGKLAMGDRNLCPNPARRLGRRSGKIRGDLEAPWEGMADTS
jgi:hypothetical protein